MIEMLINGGWMMIPIILSSLLSVAVVIERFRALINQPLTQESDRILALIKQEKFTDALQLAEKYSCPINRVLGEGIMSRGQGPDKAMEAAAMIEIASLKKGLPALDTIITLAPLLGLLGTIIGMIDSFGIMAQSGIGQPHAVTGGVAEALICTAAGIFVAVITLVPYNFFLTKIEQATESIETYATKAQAALSSSDARPTT
ncbi:MAG: MotA/TolQ/ExbB proton channel family protein [Nitrospirae bacterium]|nr:MotA/TolQ/ExbB proton channel family protein [Nitrospirota bacterium]